MSYDEMPAFSKSLVEITKTTNLTNKEQKVLLDQTLKLANAYGLVGKEAQAFMVNQTKLTSTLSHLGLEADVVQRKLNAMADGTEAGAVQALLLGYDPLGDQGDTVTNLKDRASQLVGMTEGMPIQLRNMMIQQMAPAMGLGQFGIQDIQAFARGDSLEAKKEGLTPEDINKQLMEYLQDKDKSSFQLYQTTGQLITDAFKSFQLYLIDKFLPALIEFKAGLAAFQKETLPKIKDFIDKMLEFVNTIRTFFGGKGEAGGLANLATVGAVAGLVLAVIPAIAGSLAGLLLTAVTSLVAGASTAAVLGTIVVGLIGGGLIGKFINDHLSENMKKYIGDFLYNIPDFFEKKLPGLSAAFNMSPLGLLINGIKKAAGAPTPEEVARGENALVNQPGKTLGQSTANRREELSKIGSSWAAYNPMHKAKPEEDTATDVKVKESVNWGQTDISKFGQSLGLEQTSHNLTDLGKDIPGRAKNSKHKINEAEDFSVAGKTSDSILVILNAFKAQGFDPKYETTGARPNWLPPEFYSKNPMANATHLHVEGKSGRSELATSDNDSNKILKVKDENLADKIVSLIDLLRGQVNQSNVSYSSPIPSVTIGPPSRDNNPWNPGQEILAGVRRASGEGTS
jgi:hypothetical protein